MSMGLNKQTFPVVLDKGIDTKTNKKQLQGKLLTLENGIFQTGMEITKRNGYTALPSIGVGVMLSPYNSELITLDGQSLYSYSQSTAAQVNKGALPTISLSVQNIVRNTNQQTVPDSAINGNFQCFAWKDSSGAGVINYSVYDNATKQSLVNNTLVANSGVAVKVIAISHFFVIIYLSSGALRYRTIDTATPTAISTNHTIAGDISSTAPVFDVTLINGKIFLAYNNTASEISFFTIDSTLTLSSQTNFGSDNCNSINIFGDASFNVWVVYSITGGAGTDTKLYGFILNNALNSTVLAKTQIDTFQISSIGPLIYNITSIVSGTTANVYYEVQQAALAVGCPLDFIKNNTLTLTGTIGSPAVFIRAAGLASKTFSAQSTNFVMVAYQSNLQPGYFLIRADGIEVAKISPQDGGGYTGVSILPEVNLISTGIYQTASLVKDSTTVQNGVIAAQTGVISATLTFQSTAPSKFTLAQNLHVDGAMMKMYDGKGVVEHGFNVFPEGVYSTWDPKHPTLGGGIGTGGSMAPINQKQYSIVYEWTDNEGQLHESAPSVPLTISLPQPPTLTYITGDLNGAMSPPHGGTTILNCTGSPTVGQYMNYVSSAGEVLWSWNCQITNVSGTTVTVSPGYFLVASSGASFILSDNPLSIFFTKIPSGSVLIAGFGEVNGTFGQIISAPTGLVSNYPDGTFFKSAAFTSGTFDTNNPATGLGTTQMYIGIDQYKVPIQIPTLKLTNKSGVSLAVYATQNNGSIFYRTSSPTNLIYNDPTVDYIEFDDTTSDATLLGNQQLYTTGGEVENIGVPAVGVSTTFKSRAIVVPSEQPLTWWPSKQVIPGTPVQFTDVFVQNIDARIGSISAIGAMDDKIVFFGTTSIFYSVGSGPALNGTNNDYTEPQLIPSDVGCQNQASIVLMPFGLMFQSQKGIYLLDRSLAVSYIGAEVEAFNSINVTSAQLMDTVNQVRFTLANGSELVYDYFYKQWDVFTDISANDSGIFQNQHTFINASGAIWQETPNTFTDNGSAVLMHLISNWISFANIQGFQRVYQFLLLGEWKSPHTLTIKIYANFNDSPAVQTTVIPVLTAPDQYQFRVFLNEFCQKAEAIKIEILEDQTGQTPGEGFSLANMAFVLGLKKGLYKLPATKSYG